MKKVCIIADTPYQLFNAFTCTKIFENGTCIDLYFDKKFSGFDDVENRLLECGLFHNIYFFSDDKYLGILNHTYQNSIIKNIHNAMNFNNPKTIISICLQHPQASLIMDYDVILCPSSTSFNISMILLNKDAEIDLYDEGTASYGSINILTDPFYKSRYRKLFYKLMGVNIDRIRVSKLYINNPSMCRNTTAKEVIQLPRLIEQDQDFADLVMHVFQYSPDLNYLNKTIVYLTQPMEKLAMDSETVNSEIYDCLISGKDRLIVRKHPMDKTILPKTFFTDKTNNLWELVCKDYISDQSILIGPCSTAQFTPKALYDKEPWIVFTHKLYSIDYSYFKSNFTNVVDILKNSYRNKAKIIEPSSINELKEFLNTIGCLKV